MEKPVIIVTGASRGLGLAAAKAAARMGARVVLAARTAEDLDRGVREIWDQGGEARRVSADVTQLGDCQRIVDAALEQYGQLDGLINNSGMIQPIAPLDAADPLAWQENWQVNLLGPVLMTRVALPHLRMKNGRVINVSSGASINAVSGWGAYATAKAALNHFTDILAIEEPEITAISFRPGMVDTEMQTEIREEGREGMSPEEYRRFVMAFEEGRLLQPEVPGEALACLALYASPEWSGEFISWDDPRLQALVQEKGKPFST
jgi:NAD(P)-dependent dehydrogenase (short-subunit alcohol dehydrogenase family)